MTDQNQLLREALQEECDLLHIPMPADAREAVKAVVAANVRIALDPAVSAEAQSLIDQGKAQPQGAWEFFGTIVEDELIGKSVEYTSARLSMLPVGTKLYTTTPASQQADDSRRSVDARNKINAAIHGDGAVIDDLETAVHQACLIIKRHRASQQAAQAVPEGWQLVPVKITEAMKDVGIQFEFATVSDGRLLAQSMWNELLRAAKGEQ